jgi:hypothetical protein
MVVIVHCAYCGAEKQVKESDAKRRRNHFCNHDHRGKWMSEQQKGENNPQYAGGNTKRICKNCGIEYEVPPSYVRNKEGFHSLNCYYEWRKKEAEKNKVSVECCVCHKIKRIPNHRYKKGLDKTCSKKCEAILKSILRMGKNNPNYREDADRGAYCIKFNRPFKEGVRVVWDYKCGVCEKTQSENVILKKGYPHVSNSLSITYIILNLLVVTEKAGSGISFHYVPNVMENQMEIAKHLRKKV